MNVRGSNKILVQAAIVLFLFWVIALILLTRPLLNSPLPEVNTDVLQKLSQALAELNVLKEKNQELQWILTNISLEAHPGKVKDNIKEKLRLTLEETIGSPNNPGGNFQRGVIGPSKDYEVKRRSILRGVQEMWYFLHSELEKLKKFAGKDQTSVELSNIISEISLSGAEHEM